MSFLTVPLHGFLTLLFHLTGNYGWAVLLLTLLLRLALLPLDLWQRRSAKATAVVQAEAQAIQTQYTGKEAERRLQELYGRSGRSLLTGCLLPFVQWPVFIAMYSALASFPFAAAAGFFWLKSLAAPDPYYVLPLLAIGVSVWQTYITVPRQQRFMALVMPLLMGFYVFHTSAAVALYWVASSVVTLCEQALLFSRQSQTQPL